MKFGAKKRIYFDYAATTPVEGEVVDSMKPFFSKEYGNATSLHQEGRNARTAIDESRSMLAQFLHCKSENIIYTSGGTESNNLAISGVFGGRDLSGKHAITSVIEHPSVLNVFEVLEKRGLRVSYIGVTEDGIIDMEEFVQSLTKETDLVSVMFANNEIGTLQPISDIARYLKKHAPDTLLHTDASQAPLFFGIDVNRLGVDLLTLDAHKIYGPKGIGALYVDSRVQLSPVLHGGTQESGIRAGTENVPSIVGFSKAYAISEERRKKDLEYITKLRDYFFEELQKNFPYSVINGHKEKRLPNNVNVSLGNIDGEFLVVQLDEEGIACSSRSTCFGSGGEGSSVVAALDALRAKNSVRFSLGRETKKSDIDYTIKALERAVSMQ